MYKISWKNEKFKINGAIVLVRPSGANAYLGLVEDPLTMSWSGSRVRFWWTGFVTDPRTGHCVKLDGAADAKLHARRIENQYPDWEVVIADVRDPELPVIIDWIEWAGATNKYQHRNPTFVMR